MAKKTAIVLALAGVVLCACNSNSNTTQQADKQQDAPAARKVERRSIMTIREFDHITNIGTLDIVFTHGDYSVEVEGESAMLDMVRTEFDSNLLTVSIGKDANPDFGKYNSASTVKMYVSAPSLKCVTLCNAGGFTCTDDWSEDEIQIGMFGNGKIELGNVECRRFLIDSSNSGTIGIRHLKAQTATIASRASGSIAIDCDVDEFAITNVGKQEITLTGHIGKKDFYKPAAPGLHDQTK